MFVDSHIHLSRKTYDGEFPCITSEVEDERILRKTRDSLMKEMKTRGIEFCIEPAVEIETNEQLLALANKYPDFVYPAVGVHPTRSFSTKWKDRKLVDKLSQQENVIAIGELGLDYHYERKEQHRFKQKMWFLWQLKLAHKRELPLILHLRMADKDSVKILKRYKSKLHGGICHCYNSSVEYAKIYTEELGLHLGIGGSLLQNDCGELEEVVKQIPLQYLVLETDGPFVKASKPESISNKQWQKARNTSLIIPDVAAKVAQLKNISIEEVEKVTTENVKKLFGIQ